MSVSAPETTCRQLLRAADKAVLSTILAETGEPYGSLVLITATMRGEVLMLLSDLADHTKNLKADNRASILVDGTAGLDDPLTGARASLHGTVERVDDPTLIDRYVRRHPSAAMYRGFKDFNLYRLTPDKAHLVAGFGRIHWVQGDGLLYDGETDALAAAESGIIDHMNDDHLDAIQLYAHRLLGLDGPGWLLTGVDPEGCDLRRGGAVARLAFDTPVATSDTVRTELVRLVKKARNPAA